MFSEFTDFINGCFEFGAGIMVLLNIRRTYLDKQVKGFSVWPLVFFTSWGYYNLIFYPAHGLWWSFLGGISITLVNSTWIAQIIYYTRPKAKAKIDTVLGWAHGILRSFTLS
jgi:hypothetical protein